MSDFRSPSARFPVRSILNSSYIICPTNKSSHLQKYYFCNVLSGSSGAKNNVIKLRSWSFFVSHCSSTSRHRYIFTTGSQVVQPPSSGKQSSDPRKFRSGDSQSQAAVLC